jgi:predicted esterase YcpF (UPF0227 family)
MSNAILYLHGFNSSPDSYKARALAAFMRERGLASCLKIPAIEPFPDSAISQLSALIEAMQLQHDQVAVAGSSLGGFYATWLAERFACRAVLINPAVRPDLLLEKYLGENINYYTSARWRLDASHIEQLRLLDVEHITEPQRYLLMLQTGDETLDYRQAQAKYAACPAIIEQGGDHAFSGFERHIPRMLEFCGIV